MSTVTFDGVSKLFPSHDKGEAVVAVSDLNLVIEEGKLVTLLGPSGCGKTTILRMLAGFESATGGRILLDDVDVTKKPVNTRGIGMVFQSYALFPHMTVFENVAYGLTLGGVRRNDMERRVTEVMELMHIAQYAHRAPNQLSGGQQQRVALARAVVTEPRVLLFDEPLSNLDAQLREQMRDELRAIQQRLGITSLYVTHDQSEALAISDEIIVLKEGVIRQRGTADDMYHRPADPFVARFLGKANIVPGVISALSGDELTVSIDQSRATASHAGSSVAVGEEASCVIRPENVVFQQSESGRYLITNAVFQGMYVEYHLTLGDAAFTIVDHGYAQRGALRAGDRIDIDFARTPVWVLPSHGVRA